MSVPEWFCCRSNPNALEKCPVSTTDLKDMYNGLVKHIFGGAKTDFWSGQKPRRDTYANYLLKGGCLWTRICPERIRRSTDFLSITAEDLAVYKSLTDNCSEFMTTCKSRDSRQKLLDLWNFWLWTIVIWSSVMRWRPMKLSKANVELMISSLRLKDDEWEELGLPAPYHSSGRHLRVQ